MPDLPADLPPHTTVGQSRNGRWWSQCTRPPCDHYTSGLLTRDAAHHPAVPVLGGRVVISLIRHPFRWLAHKLVAAAWRYLP